MEKLLRVLHIEDVAEDSLRIVEELLRGGYELDYKRVETAKEMSNALKQQEWDIVLSDYALPNFNGFAALDLLKETGLDLPFILISGIFSEARAVVALKNGAHDFIKKENLSRLLPAIKRELNDAQIRREKYSAEKALVESEAKYRTLYDSSQDAIMMLSAEEGFFAGNPATIEMFRCKDEEEFTSQHPATLSPEFQPDGSLSMEKAQKMMSIAMENGSHFFDWTHKRIDGEEFFATVLLTRIELEGNFYLQATVRDITERELAEEERRKSEKKFRTITDAVMDAIIMIDSDGKTTFWNPAAESMFGYKTHEMIGKKLHDYLLPPELLEAHEKAFPNFVKNGKGDAIGKSLVLNSQRKDGSTFPIELTLSAIKMDEKWHAVGIVRDISERIQLDAQLRQALKLESIGQLAAGIAHEINTPIQYIGDNTRFVKKSIEKINSHFRENQELIKLVQPGTEAFSRFEELNKKMEETDLEFLFEEIPLSVDQSLEGVERVAKIVRAMKDFSHPGQVEKTPVDINRALESTITVARNEWKYATDLETDFTPDLPLINGLGAELNQVFLNLIVNAAQAIKEKIGDNPPEKGIIRITTGLKDNSIVIKVSDSGPGIPEKVRERIFDPFFTTKEVGKGTGQGLAIAYNVITEKHGGKISFNTESGTGTEFIIHLPVEY
ncbi:PAS domain S-box protein [Calditrichota bacterium]